MGTKLFVSLVLRRNILILEKLAKNVNFVKFEEMKSNEYIPKSQQTP